MGREVRRGLRALGIAVDSAGNIYVADTDKSYDPQGCTGGESLGESLGARAGGDGGSDVDPRILHRWHGSKQVLIRGVGPTLAQYGVSGVLADPQLKLFNAANTLINQNDDWGGSAALANAFAAVQDFALPANSRTPRCSSRCCRMATPRR